MSWSKQSNALAKKFHENQYGERDPGLSAQAKISLWSWWFYWQILILPVIDKIDVKDLNTFSNYTVSIYLGLLFTLFIFILLYMYFYKPYYIIFLESSIAQSCPSFCNPMDCSMPGFPIHHQLLKLVQIHVHWISDTIQPSHPLSSPSPPAFNLGQHQGHFKWVSCLHQVAKVLEFQLQHQSFRWIFRTDFL